MKNRLKRTKKGRSGSMAVSVLIHAPPIPKDKSTKGTTQHTDAPIAATKATILCHDEVLMDLSLSGFM